MNQRVTLDSPVMRASGMALSRDANFMKKFGDPKTDFSFSGGEYNRLFTKSKEGIFFLSHFAVGLENNGDTRTSIAADFDNDGDLDVVERVLQKDGLRFFENVIEDTRESIEITLAQPGKNPQAIGALVYLECDGHRQMRQMSAGDSFLGQSPYRLFFGIGECKGPVTVEVRWPDQDRQHVVISDPGLWIVTKGVSQPRRRK